MVISQTAEYALRAVTWLAAHDAERTNQQIAHGTQVPSGYLAKVLQSLGRADLVRSQRGMGGGFSLSRTPAQITALEVINAVDPIRRILSCPLALENHCEDLCPLHRRIDEAIGLVERAFGDTTIAELEGTFSTHGAPHEPSKPRSGAAR